MAFNILLDIIERRGNTIPGFNTTSQYNLIDSIKEPVLITTFEPDPDNSGVGKRSNLLFCGKTVSGWKRFIFWCARHAAILMNA